MSWFGKMVGGTIGLMIGGPLGAVAGAVIGHKFFDAQSSQQRVNGPGAYERAQQTRGPRGGYGAAGMGGGARAHRVDPSEERQAAFFLALFSILGKLAKADGRITREEGDAVVSFLDRMHVQGDQRQFAIRVFNEAKDSRYSADDFARQFAQMTVSQPDLRSSLLDMLFQIALADGEFHSQEEAMIASIASILGIAGSEFTSIRNRYIGNAEHAYSVLGLTAAATDEEIRKAYRQLVQEYHPDRIVSQGMPDEFVEYATQRFQEIQSAWETLKTQRNLS